MRYDALFDEYRWPTFLRRVVLWNDRRLKLKPSIGRWKTLYDSLLLSTSRGLSIPPVTNSPENYLMVGGRMPSAEVELVKLSGSKINMETKDYEMP